MARKTSHQCDLPGCMYVGLTVPDVFAGKEHVAPVRIVVGSSTYSPRASYDVCAEHAKLPLVELLLLLRKDK